MKSLITWKKALSGIFALLFAFAAIFSTVFVQTKVNAQAADGVTVTLISWYDDRDMMIPGAHLNVHEMNPDGTDGTMIYLGYTDSYGKVVLKNLKRNQDYCFYEATPPSGLRMTKERYEFRVEADGTVTGELVMHHTGPEFSLVTAEYNFVTGCYTPIGGAEILLMYDDGRKIGQKTSTESGNWSFKGLPTGTWYKFKEIKAPKGYELNTNPYTIYFNRYGEFEWFSYDMKNTFIPHRPTQFTVTKKDAQTGAPLVGATIGIYDTADNQLASAVTDEGGHASFYKLEGGKDYYLKEIKPADGYQANQTKYAFRMNDAGKPEAANIQQGEMELSESLIPPTPPTPPTPTPTPTPGPAPTPVPQQNLRPENQIQNEVVSFELQAAAPNGVASGKIESEIPSQNNPYTEQNSGTEHSVESGNNSAATSVLVSAESETQSDSSVSAESPESTSQAVSESNSELISKTEQNSSEPANPDMGGKGSRFYIPLGAALLLIGIPTALYLMLRHRKKEC